MSDTAVAVDPALSQAPQDLHVLNDTRTAVEDQARDQQIKALDDAPDMEAYKALRKAGKDGTAPEPETPETAAARARDEKGRFSANKRDSVVETTENPPVRAQPKPRDDPQARRASIQADIDAAVKEREAARRDVAEARAEAARLRAEREGSREPVKQAEAPAEKFQAFEQWSQGNPDGTYEDYLDERAEWRIERRFTAEAQKREQAEAGKRIETLQTTHAERIAAARDAHPDWDEKAAAVAHIQPNHTLYAAVVTSDRSDDLTYYLMTHPQEYAQLAARTQNLPVAAADLVRDHLETLVPASAASSTGPAVPMRQSRANPPPKPVGGSPSVSTVDPEDQSIDDYRRSFLARQKAKRERGR